MQSVSSLVSEIERESSLRISLDWRIKEDALSSKEKIELLAIIRESLLNVYKHADARQVGIVGEPTDDGWVVRIVDDGVGWSPEHDSQPHFGVRMMEDRAANMRWQFSITRSDRGTAVVVRKAGS